MAFRFRAAAALDIRRRQEEQARLDVARAEVAVMAARAQLQAAVEALGADAARFGEVQSAGAQGWLIGWHRSWIERQRHVVDERTADVARRAAEAAAAVRTAQEALKRRRVLERLRDRAHRRHVKAAEQRHLQDMNELATLRFVAQATEKGGRSAD